MTVKDRYFIKVVPRGGNAIHRFELTRRHIYSAGIFAVVALFTAFGVHLYQLHQAKSQVQALQVLTTTQGDQLKTIDRQTAKLKSELQTVQKQNQQIQQLIGVHPSNPGKGREGRAKMSRVDAHNGFSREAAGVESNLTDLAVASKRTTLEAAQLRQLTMRILNVRHIEQMQRAQMVAAIPSIDPVDGASVVGCFCYRTSPDVGFHQGVDIGANYGETVRAAAAGTIASADWDGGFGIKVDIDHGNGYHTWYAHLSKTNVHPGERVVKGEPIALVGSTGFSTGPHLHYQVMLNGTPIDPAPYLGGVPPKVLAQLP